MRGQHCRALLAGVLKGACVGSPLPFSFVPSLVEHPPRMRFSEVASAASVASTTAT